MGIVNFFINTNTIGFVIDPITIKKDPVFSLLFESITELYYNSPESIIKHINSNIFIGFNRDEKIIELLNKRDYTNFLDHILNCHSYNPEEFRLSFSGIKTLQENYIDILPEFLIAFYTHTGNTYANVNDLLHNVYDMTNYILPNLVDIDEWVNNFMYVSKTFSKYCTIYVQSINPEPEFICNCLLDIKFSDFSIVPTSTSLFYIKASNSISFVEKDYTYIQKKLKALLKAAFSVIDKYTTKINIPMKVHSYIHDHLMSKTNEVSSGFILLPNTKDGSYDLSYVCQYEFEGKNNSTRMISVPVYMHVHTTIVAVNLFGGNDLYDLLHNSQMPSMADIYVDIVRLLLNLRQPILPIVCAENMYYFCKYNMNFIDKLLILSGNNKLNLKVDNLINYNTTEKYLVIFFLSYLISYLCINTFMSRENQYFDIINELDLFPIKIPKDITDQGIIDLVNNLSLNNVIDMNIKIFEKFNLLADEMYTALSRKTTNSNYNSLISISNLLYLAFDTIKIIPLPIEIKSFMELVIKFDYTLESLDVIIDGSFEIVHILIDMRAKLESIKDINFLHITRVTKSDSQEYFATYDYLNYIPPSTTSLERIENVSLNYGKISDDLTSNKSILFSTKMDGSIIVNENPHIKTIVDKIMNNESKIIKYNKINKTDSCMLKSYSEYNNKIRPKNIDVII